LPRRFRNAAIASRDTASPGQNNVAEVQPSVIERFFSHTTLGQNALAESTSVNPAQGAAIAEPATASQAANAAATTFQVRIVYTFWNAVAQTLPDALLAGRASFILRGSLR